MMPVIRPWPMVLVAVLLVTGCPRRGEPVPGAAEKEGRLGTLKERKQTSPQRDESAPAALKRNGPGILTEHQQSRYLQGGDLADSYFKREEIAAALSGQGVASVGYEGGRLRAYDAQGNPLPDSIFARAPIPGWQASWDKYGNIKFRSIKVLVTDSAPPRKPTGSPGIDQRYDQLWFYQIVDENNSSVCNGDPAIMIPGRWDPSNRQQYDGTSTSGKFKDYITFACIKSAIAHCACWGYVPWTTHNGNSLDLYHVTCVALARASYTDGISHTSDSTLIKYEDKLGFQKKDSSVACERIPDQCGFDRASADCNTKKCDYDPPVGFSGDVDGFSFESAWDESGLVCLQRTRYYLRSQYETPDNGVTRKQDLADISTQPWQLGDRSQYTCTWRQRNKTDANSVKMLAFSCWQRGNPSACGPLSCGSLCGNCRHNFSCDLPTNTCQPVSNHR